MWWNIAAQREVGDIVNPDQWTHSFYIITIILALLGDVLIPIMFFRFERTELGRRAMHEENRKTQREAFNEIDGRMNHLDDCLDNLRETIIGRTATREDLETMANKLRMELGATDMALNQRIFRLEDRAFK